MTPTGHHPAPAWFDISTPDASRTRHFYQEMFGWQVNILDETYALVTAEDGSRRARLGRPRTLAPPGWS
ncbi:hypothetical protein ACFQX6_44395 [Streptosporangium lutulentum]